VRRAPTVLALALLALAVASASRAQEDPDAKAAEAVILRQLAAFRTGDFDTAYGFAAASIQQTFDRPAFERMVVTGYPEIARSAHATIDRNERTAADRRHVIVRIIGVNGHRIEALYELVREGGGWRISGVVTRPDSDAV
jgi:uncharacterized protein DUF4864